MELVSAEANARRETFFKLLFGPSATGYVCLAYKPVGQRLMREEFYKYPEELPRLLESINRGYLQNDVYYCPQLFESKRRTKEHAEAATAVWADLDTCRPDLLLVEPTITIESSVGRYQALWCLEDPVDPFAAEETAKNIAYHHRGDGADISGWDVTQLLRVPFTHNYKYENQDVKVVGANKAKYRLSDFSKYPPAPQHGTTSLPFPDELPSKTADELMFDYRIRLIPAAWQLYENAPESASWNEDYWRLQLLLFEAGMSPEEAFVVCKEAKCNKWVRDGKSDEFVWKDLVRAYGRHEENMHVAVPRASNLNELELISQEEREWVEAHPTFVERYIQWASSLGDAATQYHQAGAFTVLSSLLAGTVRLPTSFGVVVPNLWFMILADTTLTRKTTAMDIAMDLIMEVDDNAVLATDGSIEGLMTSLAMRPGKPSIFLRDEFSGLLESITKKDYYAGMAETLTKLYDGKFQKRILRKEVIEVRDPVLIILAGGIRNRVTGLLTFDHVSSGFMPRFVFITAESDPGRVRPIGPPTAVNLEERDKILREVTELGTYYQTKQVITIKQLDAKVEKQTRWDAEMTAEAWQRYNELENAMMKAGLESERPDIMTPTYDRLCKSALKAAVLMAASRQRSDKVVVELEDLVHAIYYMDDWRIHTHKVINSVGMTDVERELDKVAKAIQREQGVSRSVLMQRYHLTSRSADAIFSTLEQRGLITRSRKGRGEVFHTLREMEPTG